AEGDPNQETIHHSQLTNHHCENEPNSPLTSITEMTYNRSRYAKEKRNDPNHPPSGPKSQ
ncbi:MAG: hypothetical protein J7M40_01775, partial [Planctomycetes bacterium]|nr:hypothetical protein [Planctomycetota bacterium]